MSHSLQLKKLAPLESGRAASSAQRHRDYREAGFLTAYLKKEKTGNARWWRCWPCSSRSPLSLPPPVSSEESRKGKEAYDLLLGDGGGSSGHGQLQNLVPREPAFSGKTTLFRCTCKSSPFTESLPQTTWFFLRGVCHPMGLGADFCGCISTWDDPTEKKSSLKHNSNQDTR